MSFLIKISKNANGRLLEVGNLESIKNITSSFTILFFNNNPGGKHEVVNTKNSLWYFIGDFIVPSCNINNKNSYLSGFAKDFSFEKLREARGNFYLLCIDKESNSLKVFSSLMSILPIYYYSGKDGFYIASRMDLIVRSSSDIFRISKKYIFEHILWGYGFQDETLYQGIKLLPTNHYLIYNKQDVRIIDHTKISDYFVTNPLSWRNTRDHLSDIFIERASEYLPDDTYYSSLTGGLDGRSLLALGLYNQKNIVTYSYGTINDKDVIIPKYVSSKIGIEYKPFILDDIYAEVKYFKHAQMAGYLTEGNLRFSRATYLYLCEELSPTTSYMVSGNFGSELMRTMRMYGNLLSHHIFDLFEIKSDKDFEISLKDSSRLKYIDKNYFKSEIDEVTHNAIAYRNSLPTNTNLNQRFYIFLFEEVFRKYFGPEIILESNFLYNRTPFLDFKFITELLNTKIAGCNGEYKLSNPLERFKGQVFYPYIIKKTYPKLLQYKLDREYAPKDFFSMYGHLKIVIGYIRRKYFIDQERYKQPIYSELVFTKNLNKILSINFDYPFLNRSAYSSLFREDEWKGDYINFNIHISLLDNLNYILSKNNNVKFE